MSTLPTGTITFLMTDIEGSTRLWETQPDAMRADLERHETLVSAAVTGHDGHIFKTVGDAFCAAFSQAENAVYAALAAQIALGGLSWAVGAPGLRVRIALHTGEAQSRGGDYFGPPLNRAARLRDAGHGGQILLSQATEQIVRDRLPPAAALRDLGQHRLKDLARPEQIFQLVHPELPGDFPRLRSLDALPNNLPQRLDSFIGRERELGEVKRLLASSRLLTLTGVGGAGKTRLAQQTAAERADDYPQGVWLVALESLTDPALVPQAVAQALGVREQPGRPLLETLCDALRGQTTLLLLDNCEHVIAASAQLTETLLQSCPHLRALATSREPLGIRGEAVYPVPPLLAPGAGDAPDDGAAVRLFIDRASLSLPSFTLTSRNAPAVRRICRQLDGIPLAIELAAPRVRILTPEQISSRLEADFRLLTGGSRTALPRQQTMQAAIQWSHDLLTEPERLLFRRLSVFAGGWTLEAAETVCAGDGLDEWDILDLLSSLASKSLVQVDENADGARRYRMLETLRQYSWSQLLASSHADSVRDRHRDWFLALAERAEPELRGPNQKQWLDCLEADHDNLRAALAWSRGETRLRLASALHRFWLLHGYLGEGRQWLETAMSDSSAAGPPIRADALNAGGVLAWAQSDYDAAQSLQEEALAIYQAIQNQSGIAKTWANLGIIFASRGQDTQARKYYEQSLSLFRRLDDTLNVAVVLVNLSAHHIVREELDTAQSLLHESLSILERREHRSLLASVMHNLGQIAYRQRDWQAASARFSQSLVIRRELGDQRNIADSLFFLARTEAALTHEARAVVILGAVQAICDRVQAPLWGDSRRAYDLLHGELQGRLDTELFTQWWEVGQTMTPETAIDYALQDVERFSVPTSEAP